VRGLWGGYGGLPGLRRGSPDAIVNEAALGVGPLGPEAPTRVLWFARQMPAPMATRSRATHIKRRPSTWGGP